MLVTRTRQRRLTRRVQRRSPLLLLVLLFCCSTAFVTHHGGVAAWKFRFPGRKKDQAATVGDHVSEEAIPFLTEGQLLSSEYEDLFTATLNGFQVTKQPLVEAWDKLKEILFYEPPVGFVAVVLAVRLVWSGRIFRLYRKNTLISAEGMLQQAESKQKTHRVRPSPAFYLESDDFAYDSYGGVQRIRRKLCWAALHGIHESLVEKDSEADDTAVTLAMEALRATPKPGSPRALFVEDAILPLTKLEVNLAASTPPRKVDKASGGPDWAPPSNEAELVVQTSAKVAEIRALDALLRLTRDRLVVTSSRLARTVRHWKRRVRMQRALKRWVMGRLVHETQEGDQLVLSMVRASYETEITHLGAIQSVLMKRPEDMSEKDFINVLSRRNDDNEKKKMPRGGASERKKRFRFSLPALSKYALRWNADGRGRLSIRIVDDFESGSSQAALQSLTQNENEPREWLSNSHAWTQDARNILYAVLKESARTLDIQGDTSVMKNLARVEIWSNYSCNGSSSAHVQLSWTSVLNLIESLDTHRQIGEGRDVRFDVGLAYLRRLDIFGIPSSLAMIALAKVVHIRLLPYWPKVKALVLHMLRIAWTIFEKRFWKPGYGIVKSLISKKSSSLLDAFDVDNEETSLDNMLRDLGLGDGSPEARREAIQGAARAYEDEMNSGVLRSAMRGRLVRLLLVQVQQLKAGLLHALASIDILVDANKLNLQILAAIPSVLLVIFGTRFFVRALFTVRSKDFRSLRDVHTEMAQYLNEMEKLLIVSTIPSGSSTPVTMLERKQLGEYCLYMHSYLVLLDYCAPPFPVRVCESIQKTMNDLLGMQASGAGLPSQVDMVHLLRQQHMELEKYL